MRCVHSTLTEDRNATARSHASQGCGLASTPACFAPLWFFGHGSRSVWAQKARWLTHLESATPELYEAPHG